MLTIQNYKKVESLEEAYELNQKKANRIVGGMMWMRMGDNRMNTAIDMSGLGLDKIEESDEEFKIGCMATLRQLEVHESFNEYTDGCAKEALRHIVGVQFRNLATVGGSIYGRYGFSDVLTLLIGLDSYVELYKGGIVPLTEYADRDYDRDIVVNIIVKKRPVNMFYEAVRITETDLPVLTCAGVKFKDTGVCNICIGARPGRAIVVKDTEGILAGGINEKSVEEFSTFVKKNVPTAGNMRGSAEYRSHLAGVLAGRALQNINRD
jgi:putative selenate reductase FAD-binding subunit